MLAIIMPTRKLIEKASRYIIGQASHNHFDSVALTIQMVRNTERINATTIVPSPSNPNELDGSP